MHEPEPNNRYRTPFDVIQEIKYFAWCQKSRMKAMITLPLFLQATDGEPVIDRGPHRIRLPQSQCQGKKKYHNWAHANRALTARKIYNSATGGKEYLKTMRIYHCEHCGFWHMGHRPST